MSLHAVPWAGMQFLSLFEQLTRILKCLFLLCESGINCWTGDTNESNLSSRLPKFHAIYWQLRITWKKCSKKGVRYLEPGNNRQCDINLVFLREWTRKRQQNRNQFLGVVKPRTRQQCAGQQVARGVGWSHNSYRFIIIRTSTISDSRQAWYLYCVKFISIREAPDQGRRAGHWTLYLWSVSPSGVTSESSVSFQHSNRKHSTENQEDTYFKAYQMLSWKTILKVDCGVCVILILNKYIKNDH